MLTGWGRDTEYEDYNLKISTSGKSNLDWSKLGPSAIRPCIQNFTFL